jgi:hypothetical protein
MADRIVAWLLRQPNRSGYQAPNRVLQADHFEFRGSLGGPLPSPPHVPVGMTSPKPSATTMSVRAQAWRSAFAGAYSGEPHHAREAVARDRKHRGLGYHHPGFRVSTGPWHRGRESR